MQLSENFFLGEFLISQTATRHQIDMTPPTEVRQNIVRLVETILQPLRIELGHAIIITSGFRPDGLNRLIGGSKTSAHRFGCAVDFHSNRMSALDLSKLIVEMDLLYDQVIHEFGAWVHAGIRWDDQDIRKEELTAYKNSINKTVYVSGLHAIADVL